MTTKPIWGRRLPLICALALAGMLGGATAGAQPNPGEEAGDPAGALGRAAAEVQEAPEARLPSGIEVVASGLDNPRGMEFGRGGALFVAEAGRGGSDCSFEGPEGRICYGRTGAVTRIEDGEQKLVVGGLPSFAAEDGSGASGPHDVSIKSKGTEQILYVAAGEGDRRGTGDDRFSRLLRLEDGKAFNGADLLAYERRNNPDGGEDPSTGKPELNSNPYSLVAGKGGQVVADAAGNSLLRVREGRISTLAVFRPRPLENPGQIGLPPGFRYQAVPNAVTRASDGSYFVGELTGFPFPRGEARVYKVSPGESPKVYASGFTNIIDVAYGRDGSVYVLEIVKKGLLQSGSDPSGRLVRVYPGGRQKVIASEGLVTPTGVAIAENGDLYVSNFGIFPKLGQVVRITQ